MELDFREMKIEPVPVEVAEQLVSRNHYSRVMPKITHLCYGGIIDSQLVAIITLGWGVRPLHTIRKLFPQLTTADYWEIGKMCLIDDLPRNSESWFLAHIVEHIKAEHPEKKILYTWADGLVGKPGYVYQAANFLYGGFIWTDAYFTPQGEKIHPRLSRAIMALNPDDTRKARPSLVQLQRAGILHYQGKQFRYCLPLLSPKESKKLLDASTVVWSRAYPKAQALEWKKQLADGTWMPSDMPLFTSNSYRFNKVHQVASAVQGILM